MRKSGAYIYFHDRIRQKNTESKCDQRSVQEPRRGRWIQHYRRGGYASHIDRVASRENSADHSRENSYDCKEDKSANGVRALCPAGRFRVYFLPPSFLLCSPVWHLSIIANDPQRRNG